jgi:hypothetical protein
VELVSRTSTPTLVKLALYPHPQFVPYFMRERTFKQHIHQELECEVTELYRHSHCVSASFSLSLGSSREDNLLDKLLVFMGQAIPLQTALI